MSKRKITGRWICVWPDKSKTLVFDAFSEMEAIEALDEIGPAEPYMLVPIAADPACVDFTYRKDKGHTWQELYMVSEELGVEVQKHRKIKKIASVEPVSTRAKELATYLGMSQTLANARFLAHQRTSADLAQEKTDGL